MVGRQTEELYPGESLLIPSDDGRLSTPRMGHHGPQALYPGDPESRARTPIEIAPYATHGRPIIHGSGPMTHHDLSNQNDLHPLIETPIPGSFDCIPGSEGPPEPGLCAGCGDRISDRYYLLAVGKPWHANCLRCAECKLTLDSELTCFAKDGSIYCKEDYYRRFALKRCSGCQQGISAQDLVMRARHLVYHLNCFTCAACHKMLTTGEHFGIHDNHIFCRIHYEMALQQDENNKLPSFKEEFSPGSGNVGGRLFGGTQKGRPRKRKPPQIPDVDLCPGMMGGMTLRDGEYCDLDLAGLSDRSLCGGGYGSKHKRMRTSFKHHQLRTMKSYFALNHNPDAKDLKELSQKTGLSKKVLQVWFQNARAKYRRNVLRQNQDKSHPGGAHNSDENLDSKNSLSDFSQSSRSPGALSDISSSASMNELHGMSHNHSRGMSHDLSTNGSHDLSHDIKHEVSHDPQNGLLCVSDYPGQVHLMG